MKTKGVLNKKMLGPSLSDILDSYNFSQNMTLRVHASFHFESNDTTVINAKCKM
jgi:hypothetical protein